MISSKTGYFSLVAQLVESTVRTLARPSAVTFENVSNVDRTVSVVRSGFRLASGDPQPASPPPALGADTRGLLAQLGFTQGEIDALARDGAI